MLPLDTSLIFNFFLNARFVFIIFNPLLNFLIFFFQGRVFGIRGVWYTIIISNLIQFFSFFHFFLYDFLPENGQNIFYFYLGHWFYLGDLKVNFSFIFDGLSIAMLQLVMIISMVTQLYSFFYLQTDANLIRFQAYISLFTFFMIILVVADNLILFFTGWEGVGLCSYLLISFWAARPEARLAGLKAVAVNRIGDCAFIGAAGLIFSLTKTIEFSTLFSTIDTYTTVDCSFYGINIHILSLTGFLLLIAVMSKSAQIGLHIWLADAMEGPTPVSALIHAATMVTAGIYLLLRLSILFEFTPGLNNLIAYIGALTAFFGASTAAFQWDIKKIIAYSTCSQLGYMLCICGFGGYQYAFYHLIMHGYFKALLFFASGIIIHNFNGEQDIRWMGQFHSRFPLTLSFFIVGLAALLGLPGTSGFYSKEKIYDYLSVIPTTEGLICYNLLLGALVFTAFYSTKIIKYVFFSSYQGPSSFFKPTPLTRYSNFIEIPHYITALLTVLVFFSLWGDFFLHNLIIGHGSTFLNTAFPETTQPVNAIIAELQSTSNRYLPLTAILVGIFFFIGTEKVTHGWLGYIRPSRFKDSPSLIKFFIILYKDLIRHVCYFFQKGWFADYCLADSFFKSFKFFVNASLIFEKGLCEIVGPYGISLMVDFIVMWANVYNIPRPVLLAISLIPISQLFIFYLCFFHLLIK